MTTRNVGILKVNIGRESAANDELIASYRKNLNSI
jgi:hypothetical protein